MNFYAKIETQLSQDTERELICTTGGEIYSRGAILDRASQMANTLASLGAQPGDRISVQTEKSVENLCLYLGCLKGGYVYHPLNPAYQQGEVTYFIENAEPVAIVCDPAKREGMIALAERFGIAHVLTLDAQGKGDLAALANGQSTRCDTVDCADDDMAALLYSSGTTGVPKGIMLTHGNLASNAEVLVDLWGFTDQDKLFHCLPIFHVHGLFVALGCVFLSGASIRWAASFAPELACEHLPDCTVMMGVPTYYTRLLGHTDFVQDVAANMRLFISGSAPLLAETFAEFEERTGHRILERYGMTETGMNTSNPLTGERKPGTVGPPLPGVECRIVTDDGRPTSLGEVGNLQVRGPNVFKGYWRMPEKTEEDFLEGGWFNTGDKASEDGDGYVSIAGRSKDMVITGGLNVYPKEIELVLDAIDGVRESAVFGVPHPDFGEAVVAVVVPVDSASVPAPTSVVKHAKEQLASFKVPKQVWVMDALPRNTMGKVQKKTLRERYADTFTQA